MPQIRGQQPRRSTGKQGHIVSTKGLAEVFGITIQTVDSWRKLGMPVYRKVSERKTEYDTAACYIWRLNQENKLLTNALKMEKALSSSKMTLEEARTRKESAFALMAELDLAKAQEQVANIDDLMTNFAAALSEVRAKIISQSSRLTGILTHQEEDSVRAILEKDATETLEALCAYEHEYKEQE